MAGGRSGRSGLGSGTGEDARVEDGEGDGEGEMSRMLTHEEVWDDSALIDAWESATAEYEVRFNSSYLWRKYG